MAGYLQIAEYERLAVDVMANSLPMGLEPALVEQAPIAIGSPSVQSAAFNASTRFVCIRCSGICSIAFGTNPTAVITSAGGTKRLPADHVEFFSVSTSGLKVAVIADT